MINLYDIVQLKNYRDALGDDIFHIGVAADLGQIKEARGFGSDNEKSVALQKAMSELVERIAFLEFGSCSEVATSNGFAAHPNLDQAMHNSVAELIERDVVMTRWMLKMGPTWLEDSSIDSFFSGWSAKVLPLFAEKAFLLKVGIWGNIGRYKVFVMCLKSERDEWGFSIATKASLDLQTAIGGLINDCRRAATVMESFGHSIGKLPPQISEINSPMDHRTFYFSGANMVGREWFYEGERKLPVAELMPKVTTEEVILDIQMPWSLRVVRSSSPMLQQYFVGYLKNENINFNRLKSLGHLENQINHQLHPLA